MSCEICGRRGCCRSFHSAEEQEAYDNLVEPLKSRIEERVSSRLRRLTIEEFDNEMYVPYDEVKALVDDLVD